MQGKRRGWSATRNGAWQKVEDDRFSYVYLHDSYKELWKYQIMHDGWFCESQDCFDNPEIAMESADRRMANAWDNRLIVPEPRDSEPRSWKPISDGIV